MIPKLFRFVYRDAETGRFVTPAFGKANPRTTIRQRVWWWQGEPR